MDVAFNVACGEGLLRTEISALFSFLFLFTLTGNGQMYEKAVNRFIFLLCPADRDSNFVENVLKLFHCFKTQTHPKIIVVKILNLIS
jgi:hypothetical protein